MKIRLNPKYTANETKRLGAFIVGREWKECDANVAKAATPFSMGENAAFELSATVPVQPPTSWPSPAVAAPVATPAKVLEEAEPARESPPVVEAPVKSKPGRKKKG
jgi:hypothetical protein